MIHIICWALAIVFLFPFIEETVKYGERIFNKKLFDIIDWRL